MEKLENIQQTGNLNHPLIFCTGLPLVRKTGGKTNKVGCCAANHKGNHQEK
jgi:hypothetical protein